MKKKKGLFIFLLLILTFQIFSQDNGWRFVNFECGGYVTAVFPLYYPLGQQPANINQQVLYCRTDIGGIYRSTNNGVSWDYLSCYFNFPTGGKSGVTLSELSIQGMAVRHNGPNSNSPQTIVVAWGNNVDDAKLPDDRGMPYQSIWRSDNNGNTGTWLRATINYQGNEPKLWFEGNNLPIKIGGECIVYDPNRIDFVNPPNANNSVLYTGGSTTLDDNNPYVYGPGRLFKSEDDGRTWNRVINFPGIDKERIICIQLKQGDNDDIWVGTTKGIVYSQNNGTSWTRIRVKNNSGAELDSAYVRRIILKGTPVTKAFVVWGYYLNDNAITGIGKVEGGIYTPVTNFGATDNSLMSILNFGDNENVILAGSYERSSSPATTRKTTNEGASWQDQPLYYNTDTTSNPFPRHSIEYLNSPIGGSDNNIYSGMNQMIRNPNPNWGYQYYMSGGAGLRMTTGSGVQNNNWSAATWKYSVKGQSMTVIYDVVFKNINVNGSTEMVYFPLSDWTMGWDKYSNLYPNPPNWLIPARLNYDRHITHQLNLEDTYISNVTRIVFHPDNPNHQFCMGGSVYKYSAENRRAGFYFREVSSNGTVVDYRRTSHPFLTTDDRAIVDGIMYAAPGGARRIISLVGMSSQQIQPGNSSTLGIFYNDDYGVTWVQGNFTDESLNPLISTQDQFENSYLPALNGTIGELFDGHFTLAKGPNLTQGIGGIIYLWLESAPNSSGGGLFISTNDGQSWRSAALQPHSGYKGPGSIKYLGNNQIALAVRAFGYGQLGLYRGTINTNNGEITNWVSLGDFVSAEHLDATTNASYWAVYGKRTGDKYNQIYRSRDNGSSWQRIPLNNPLPYFPKVHSLRIRPHDGSLWIATSGQGVWIYTAFTASEHTSSY